METKVKCLVFYLFIDFICNTFVAEAFITITTADPILNYNGKLAYEARIFWWLLVNAYELELNAFFYLFVNTAGYFVR